MKLYHVVFAFILPLTVAQEHVSRFTPVQACIIGCPAVNVCCISACQGILCPVGLYADRAARCISVCRLGTGTPEDAAEYTQCRENCIFSNQPPNVTSSSATSTSSSSSATTSSPLTSTTPYSTSSSIPGASSSASTRTSTPSSSHGYTGTATHSGPSPSMTSNAASVSARMNMGGALVGLLGAVLAGI